MEKAIKLAIKGGYNPQYDFSFETPHDKIICDNGSICIRGANSKVLGIYGIEKILLDPLFWQALGKALEWEEKCYCPIGHRIKDNSENKYIACFCGEEKLIDEWLYHALRFFELKLTGGDEGKFWEELLNGRRF